jgi:acetate kinase
MNDAILVLNAGSSRISTASRKASAWVIPTDEDLMIAWRV